MEIKPAEKLAVQFELSQESAKYYLGAVQKAFKVEKPPHKLIVEFIEAQEFTSLPLPVKLASMMKEGSVWVHQLVHEPQPEVADDLPKRGRGTNRKTRPSQRAVISHEKLCPHGIPRNKTCPDCEFETFVRLTQSE